MLDDQSLAVGSVRGRPACGGGEGHGIGRDSGWTYNMAIGAVPFLRKSWMQRALGRLGASCANGLEEGEVFPVLVDCWRAQIGVEPRGLKVVHAACLFGNKVQTCRSRRRHVALNVCCPSPADLPFDISPACHLA